MTMGFGTNMHFVPNQDQIKEERNGKQGCWNLVYFILFINEYNPCKNNQGLC
jgi:hypothetical protein